MKPIRLEMRNFITYVNESLDLDKLGNNVFLITGKTGSGKTTIFDAIMFALYGVASGSSRDAKELFRSSADKKEKASVVLFFEHNGRKYRVERTISFKKTRSTGEYEYKGVDAELTGDDGTAENGAGKVTEKCREIIGFSADQFKRIVMLAQGEFKKFLDANDDDRGDILSNLFDISEYMRYQALICETAKRLGTERAEYKRICAAALQGFDKKDLSDEVKAKLSYDHPECMDTLSAIVAEEEAQLQILKDAEIDIGKKIDALKDNRTRSENDNRRLDELEQSRAELLKLIEREAEIKKREREAEAAEKALRNVKPALDKYDSAAILLNKTRTELTEKQTALPRTEEALHAAEKKLAAANEEKGHADEMKVRIEELKKELPLYDVLEEKKTERENVGKMIAAADKNCTGLQEREAHLSRDIEADEKQISELKDIDRGQLEKKQKLEKTEECLKQLEGLRTLDNKTYEAAEELDAANRALADTLKARIRAKQVWDDLDRKYSSGIAGELARQLGEALLIDDACCPVCQTGFRRGIYTFTADSSDSVKKADVEQAKTDFESADKHYQQTETRAAAKGVNYDILKEQTLKAAAEFFPGLQDHTKLRTEGLIDDREERLLDERRELKSQIDRTQELIDKRNKLEADLPGVRETLKKVREDIEQQKNRLNELRIKGAAIDAEINGIELSYADKLQAERERSQLTSAVKVIEDQIGASERALVRITKERSELEGAVSQLQKTLDAQKNDLDSAAEGLDAALKANGFADRQTAEDIMHDEAWLKQTLSELERYDADVRNAKKMTAEREEYAKGLQRTDLSELNGLIASYEHERDNCVEQARTLTELLGSHRGTVRTVCDADAKLKKTQAAYDRISYLGRIANGELTGKVTFSRYVLGEDFREVLNKANERLTVLSDGHFNLEHRYEAVNAKKTGGLGINVRDMFADRTESSGSLSGGESFMTSMALALGLADVVQARAGGNAMDTVFIDEGFGTLDEDALQNAIGVLRQLSGGNRMVGIISHVSELETAIPLKVRVAFDRRKGSSIEVVSE